MTRLLCMFVMGTLGAASGVRALHQSPPVAPTPAYSVGVAMDAGRNRLVVFGGFTGRYVADTWQWDGTAWERFSGTGPSARNSPAMVYDAARRQIVMFGGASGDAVLDDTWEWDGRRWARVAANAPRGRALAGMGYDAARRKVVLFGGMPAMGPNIPSLDDTWEYDGTTWSQVQVAGPSPRDHVAMDYDAAREVMVLHGGGLEDAEKRETWTFNGRQWVREQTSGPARRYARLAYEPASRSMLLFGGFDRSPSNELWRLNNGAWALVR